MSTSRKIMIGVILILAAPFILALFMPAGYHIERTITINQSNQIIFAYLKMLKNHDDFSTWAQKDPDMQKEFHGTDGTVGFYTTWNSQKKEVGQGAQEIKKITEGSRIDYEMRFIKPFEATDTAYFTTSRVSENQTKVVWGFDGNMAYPMNLMLPFMDFETLIGSEFQTSLAILKKNMESKHQFQKSNR